MTTITVEYEFSHELLDSLMTSAYAEGINYWCKATPRAGAAHWWEQTIFEKTDHRGRPLTLEGLLNGIKLCAKKAPLRFASFVDGRWDAITADIIVQLAIFGEIKYG